MIPPAVNPMVSMRKLSRNFGNVVAVKDIDLEIAQGSIFGLVGPDGAGKTTIMRMLAAILTPDAGDILINGIDVVATPELAKFQISYMPQRFGLYEDLTVSENIFFYAELFGIPAAVRKTRSSSLLEAAGLTPFTKRLAGRLSGGMKQKLGLVCALVHTPNLLLLDEPTTGVDPVSRREFWEILYQLREDGVTIVLSTAYMDEAERCSELAFVSAGQVRHRGRPDQLRMAMPGALLAVTADDPRRVFNGVEGMTGVLGRLLMGDRVNIRVDNADIRAAEVRQRLEHLGIPAKVDRIKPSIEDVFVALLGEEAST